MKQRAVGSFMTSSRMQGRAVRSLMNLGRMTERAPRSFVKPGRMKERIPRSFVPPTFMKERKARSHVRVGRGSRAPAHQRVARTHFRTGVNRAAPMITPAPSRDDAGARLAMPDPIPRKDSDLVTWSRAFCDGISQYAPELNIPPEKVDQLLAERDVFRTAYFRAYSPARNMADTRAKNDARKSFLRTAREVAGMARATATSVQRIAMGLKPRRVGKAPPIPRPSTAPVVHIRSVAGRIFNLHISDLGGGPRPHGAACAVVYWFAGENPPPDLRQGWCMPKMAVRRSHTLEIPNSIAPGTKIWVAAQWLSSSKLLGPSSPPIFQYVGWGMARIGGLKAA